MGKKRKHVQTEKERILLGVIAQLYHTMLLGIPYTIMKESIEHYEKHSGPMARFESGRSSHDVRQGELVLCQTSCYQAHPWTLSYVDSIVDQANGVVMLREIGTGRLCKMGNEGYIPLINVMPKMLWTDKQVEFHNRVNRVAGNDEYLHRVRSIDFRGDDAVLSVGQRWGGLGYPSGTKNYEVTVPNWSKVKASQVKTILDDAGYGKRKFDLVNPIEAEFRTGHAVRINGGSGAIRLVIDPSDHWKIQGRAARHGNPEGKITVFLGDEKDFWNHKDKYAAIEKDRLVYVRGEKREKCKMPESHCSPERLCWYCAIGEDRPEKS